MEWSKSLVEIVKWVREEGVRERGGWAAPVGGKDRRGGPKDGEVGKNG